jgi:hypothetical protein
MNGRILSLLTGLLLTTLPSLADSPQVDSHVRIPGEGGARVIGGYDFLIVLPGVQRELGLTNEQLVKMCRIVDQVTRRHPRQPYNLMDLAKNEQIAKAVALIDYTISNECLTGFRDVLRPEQIRRLKQIELQERGARAFSDPDVEKALHLTAEQKNTIDEVSRQAEKAIAGAHTSRKVEPLPQLMALGQHREIMQKALELLTPEQKKTWSALAGPAFDFEA